MRAKLFVLVLFLTSVAQAASQSRAPQLSPEEQRLFFSEKNFPGCLEQTEGSQVAARARELVRKYSPTSAANVKARARSVR